MVLFFGMANVWTRSLATAFLAPLETGLTRGYENVYPLQRSLGWARVSILSEDVARNAALLNTHELVGSDSLFVKSKIIEWLII